MSGDLSSPPKSDHRSGEVLAKDERRDEVDARLATATRAARTMTMIAIGFPSGGGSEGCLRLALRLNRKGAGRRR